MRILAIDPGNIESAYCVIDSETYKPLEFNKIRNEELIMMMYEYEKYHQLVIEMIASYGMAVEQTVFDTCVWIGRFIEAGMHVDITTEYI